MLYALTKKVSLLPLMLLFLPDTKLFVNVNRRGEPKGEKNRDEE